jgi:hypothetical protein
MVWTYTRAALLGGVVAAVGGAGLIAFSASSNAETGHASVAVQAHRAPFVEQQPAFYAIGAGHGWPNTVDNTPGLPVQCSDGTWTRTVVRAGCMRHGGVAYY